MVLLEPGASEFVTIHPPAPSCAPAYEPGPNTRVLALLVPLSLGRREKFKGNLVTVLVVQVNDPWRVAHVPSAALWGVDDTVHHVQVVAAQHGRERAGTVVVDDDEEEVVAVGRSNT